MLTFFSVERKNSARSWIKLNEGCVFCVAFMKVENQFPVGAEGSGDDPGGRLIDFYE